MDKRGWQVKLYDPSLTRAIPEQFRMSYDKVLYKSTDTLLYIDVNNSEVNLLMLLFNVCESITVTKLLQLLCYIARIAWID